MQGVVIPISMIPGNSIIHRMNPLPKLMWTVGVLAVSFSTRNPAVLGAVFVLGLLLVLIAQVGSAYLNVVMVLLPVSLALITLQSIAPAFPRPWTPIIGWGPFTVYQEGIYSGISMALRIFSLTTWAMVFIMTSHPSDIFTSLKRVGMPYTLNFILIMTLQLIPILQNEFVVVLNAQKSRAMKGTGFGALLPSMVPVFVGAIERIQQLSISLESRAFGSSGHKTSYRRVRITVWDILNLLLAVVVSGLATYWVIVDKSLDWSRTLVFNPVFSAILIGISVTGFLTYMGLAIYLVAKS